MGHQRKIFPKCIRLLIQLIIVKSWITDSQLSREMIKSHQGQFSKTESTHQHTEHNQPLTRKNYIKTMPKSKVMIFIAIKIRLMLRMKHKDEEAMVRNKLNKLINHYLLRMQMKIFTVNVNSKTSLKQNEPKVSFKVNK